MKISDLITALETLNEKAGRDLDVQIPDQENEQCWVSDFTINLAPLDEEFVYLQAEVAGNVDH